MLRTEKTYDPTKVCVQCWRQHCTHLRRQIRSVRGLDIFYGFYYKQRRTAYRYCSRCGARGERFSYRGGKRTKEQWGNQGGENGRVKVKVYPSSALALTSRVPPCSSTRERVMDGPSTLPTVADGERAGS